MAKVSLAKHKAGFEGDQKDMGKGPDVRTGKYHVVNVELGRGETANKSKKVRPLAFILKALDPDNKDLEGARFGFDLWCDIQKNQNAKKWTYLTMAHGNEDMLESVDLDDDAWITKAISGKPYFIEIEATERSYKDAQGNDKTTLDVEPRSFQALTKDQKAVYNTPQWPEIVGKPDERVKKFERKEQQKGGAGKGAPSSQENGGEPYSDPFADPQG